MSLKYLLTFLSLCLAISGFCSEFKYTKPVKALVKVEVEGNKYRVTGIFERETRFSAAFNRARERKYVRLLAENALIRYLRTKENINSIEISGAQISSNLTKAKPDEKITFQFVVPLSAVKKDTRKNSEAASVKQSQTPDKTSENPPNSDSEGDKDESDEKENGSEKTDSNISFEIASPETVFDSSWTLLDQTESKSRQDINRIISDFENKTYSIQKK